MSETTDIKITMLGGSGSGKTCFMLAMYDVMSFGVGGFTFSTVDWDDGLDLEEQWNKLCDGTGPDRWPRGTDGSRPYSFRYSYGAKTYLTFEWLDYRGGAIRGRSDDPDLPKLKSQMQESTGIFIVVPADKLILEDAQSQRTLNINSINRLLSDVRDEATRQGRLLPIISLVVTKIDVWHNKYGKGRREELVSKLKILFNPLFAPGAEWTVSIVPVTLGQDLCNDSNQAAIAPMMIHYPVTFTIHEFHQRCSDAVAQEMADKTAQKNRDIQRPKTFWEEMFGANVVHDDDHEQRIAQLEIWAKECGEACKNIGKMLTTEMPIFKNGEEINVNS